MTEPPATAALAPNAVPGVCWLALAARSESVALGRRFASDVIAGQVTDPDHAHTIVLLTSELLTNAVRAVTAMVTDRGARVWKGYHRPVRLGIHATVRYVHLLVTDPDPRPIEPTPATCGDLPETGRGLSIVDTLSAATWVVYTRYEKTFHALVTAPGVTLRPAEIDTLREQP